MLRIKSKLNVIRSNAYKEQLKLIRLEMDRIDSNCNLDNNPVSTAEYEWLQAEERKIIVGWRRMRGLAGMSNDAVPRVPERVNDG